LSRNDGYENCHDFAFCEILCGMDGPCLMKKHHIQRPRTIGKGRNCSDLHDAKTKRESNAAEGSPLQRKGIAVIRPVLFAGTAVVAAKLLC